MEGAPRVCTGRALSLLTHEGRLRPSRIQTGRAKAEKPVRAYSAAACAALSSASLRSIEERTFGNRNVDSAMSTQKIAVPT
jgi:hypothetical protein